MVLPEDLCIQLANIAEKESRTVSNMAKVLIQKGIQNLELDQNSQANESSFNQDQFISSLEAQQPRRLRGAPRRIKLTKP